MQSAFDFFHHYQTNNGFNFNINANMQKEFDRLALYMSWKGNSFSRNKRKFFKCFQISYTNNSNEEKNSYQKYFLHFQKFNGFQYNEHNEPANEFERLAKQMKWVEMNYLSNKEKFQKISECKFHENKAVNREVFTNTNERNALVKNYFLNFEKFNGFKLNAENDYEQEFARLAEKMKWKGKTLVKKKEKFQMGLQNQRGSSGRNEENVKEIKKEGFVKNYFITYQKFHKFNYDSATDQTEEFEKLAKFMNWKGTQYDGHKNKFLKSLEEKNEKNELKPVQNKNENKVRRFKKLKKKKKNKRQQNFFNIFQIYNKFDYNRDNDPHEEFERLAKFMNWKDKNYLNHKKKFLNENKATVQDFFLQFQKFNGFKYNRENEPRIEFDRLAEKMNWDAVCYSNCEKKFLKLLRRSLENNEKIEEYTDQNHNLKLFRQENKSNYEKKTINIEEKLSVSNDIYKGEKILETTEKQQICAYTLGSVEVRKNLENENESFEKSEENNENSEDDNENSLYHNNENDNDNENSEEENEIHYEIDYTSHDCERNEYKKVNTDSDSDGEEEEDSDEMDDYDIINKEGDDYDMSDFDSTQAYFDYFKGKYNFKYNKRDNAFIIFEELANCMKWNRRYYYELKQFEKIKNVEEKIDYFMEFCAETDWTFDGKFSMEKNFESLSDFLDWKEYRDKKKEFNDLVVRLVEKKFENLSQLQDIIKRYKLSDKIPTRFEECRIMLEESLFVNIYDFVAGNKRKFPDFQSLRKDTNEKELYFPLHEAKENLCYRILLRHIKN